MEQQTNQLTSPSNNTSLVLIFISIVLTAAVVGGAIIWWMNQKDQDLNNEIISLRTEVEQLKQNFNTSSTIINNQNEELIKTKFELAILDLWQVRQSFEDLQDKNKFYYVTNFGDGSSIWVYDLAKDKTYQQSGELNITEGNTSLFRQKLEQNQEFRGVGIIDNKFVFTETSFENSPGPCFSPWLYSNLSYIDLDLTNPTRKPFTLPQDLKSSEEQKMIDCQETLWFL